MSLSWSGSDVRRKLGCSIAASVGPSLRKWDTLSEHQFSSGTAVVCITSCFLHRNQRSCLPGQRQTLGEGVARSADRKNVQQLNNNKTWHSSTISSRQSRSAADRDSDRFQDRRNRQEDTSTRDLTYRQTPG